MRRRSHTALTVQQLIEQAREAPLGWPWKSTRLERSSVAEYRQRPASPSPSIAELYHENSKLFPQLLPELAIAQVDPSQFRRAVVERQSAVARASGAAEIQLDARLRGVFSAVARAAGPELFYAIELRLVADRLLAIHDPLADVLQVVKRLSPPELGRLWRSLQLLEPARAGPAPGILAFIHGRFARNEILLGRRGYRRTLIEAGQVAHELAAQATRAGLVAVPIYEFIDRDLDAVLEADGTEEGTLIAFELGETTDVG